MTDYLNHPYAFHDATPDVLCELGLYRPPMDKVLLRAITSAEMRASVQDGSIVLPDFDKLSGAVAYEIMAVGPVVQRVNAGNEVAMGSITYPAYSLADVEVGNHCIHLAASADSMNPDGQGRWHVVRACYIAAVLEPGNARAAVAAREAAKEQAEQEAQDRKRRISQGLEA